MNMQPTGQRRITNSTLPAVIDAVRRAVGSPDRDVLHEIYRRDSGLARRETTRQGLWAAAVVYILFSITDILLLGDAATYSVAGRLLAAAIVLPVFEIQYRKGASSERLDVICACTLVFCYLAWLCPSMLSSQKENLSYYLIFGAIFMMGANLFFSFRFRLSLVTSSAILVIFLMALFLFPGSSDYRLTMATFYLSCFTFTSYVNWNLNKERYSVFINAREARAQHREATERGQALLRLSRTDPLTGLENRRAIDEKLKTYWSQWQHFDLGFAAILIDVDFFKRFNDRYGHQEGDRCLIAVGNTLAEAIAPHEASLGRYGGEEFIVLARVDSHEQLQEIAEHIRHTVETLAIRHEERRDGTSIVTVSVGAAITRSQAGAKLEKIIHDADRALYLAKASGRNCVRLFDPNDPQSNDESENIAALLRIAIDRNLVSLVYQPIVNATTGRVEAMEALMRLTTPDGTTVPPSLFIPVAERTGEILRLGRWAIRTACLELLADNRVQVVSVNVSPVQLKMPGFAASIASTLAETGIDGRRLALEITEGVEMEMHSDVLRCISDLKLLGVQVWLDDFGTGFAGLSWLRLIDFDMVKVDRSFLQDASTPRGEELLRHIIDLVRTRAKRILVEGVETRDQLALMRTFKIDQVQGYYVGRPAPVHSVFQPIDGRLEPFRKSA